jgi:hypothetical protein
VITQGPSWNYTSALNIIFLVVAALLLHRFFRTGGPEMLAMMDTPEEQPTASTQAMSTKRTASPVAVILAQSKCSEQPSGAKR